VFVLLEAPHKYAARRSTVQGLYAAMYKPFHLIGLGLSISVLNAALRGEATRTPLARRCRCCR
jgi:predicted homoserine dehydrogenase-like protein